VAAAAIALTLTLVAIASSVFAVRRLGAVVRGLASRCRDADALPFERAGRGGGCALAALVVVLGFPIAATAMNASGGGVAAIARGELLLVLLGFLAVSLGIASLGRPMAAVRTERAMAKLFSGR
jgi:hypothetical protein